MMQDIFDLTNKADLPLLLRRKRYKKKLSPESKYVLDLFDLKNPLSIDEVAAALFRLHGITKPRKWITNTLWNLSANPNYNISRVKCGVYGRK